MSRLDDMLERYGEAVTKVKAGRILDMSGQTITRMLEDGRLSSCCAGTKVDVRSIAKYLESPKKADAEARQRKQGRKWGV